jgi:arabinofuranosyltransferase
LLASAPTRFECAIAPPVLLRRRAMTASADTLPSDVAASEPTRHRVFRWALLAAPVLVYAEQAWGRHWMSDDGFIYLRVVSQLVGGHGPVFNIGERVEAATGPLWVGILAVGDIVTPIRLEWLAVILGFALSVSGIAMVIAGARRLQGITGSALAIPAGAAVLVAISPLWTFATSGLETGLSYAWLGFCCWLLARWAHRDSPLTWWEALVLGLGSLIRPDFWVFSLVFLGIVLVAERSSRRSCLRILVAGLALPLAYQVFRMGYYGELVPNSAVAKEASQSRWGHGWEYIRDSFDPYWLWIPLGVLAVGAYAPFIAYLRHAKRGRELLVVGAFAVAALAHLGYVVKVGGDFMHARMALPAVFAFAAPVAVLPVRRTYMASLLLVPWVIAGLFFLRTSADNFRIFGTDRENAVTTEDYGWKSGGRGEGAVYTVPGVYYTTKRLPSLTVRGRTSEVATFGVGVPSYALGNDVYILDLLGLGDAFTSHLELARRGVPGHEKLLPAPWTAARLTPLGTRLTGKDFPGPTFIVRPLDKPDGQSFEQRVHDARVALQCTELRDFQSTYSAPLTLERFVDNVFDSFSDSSLRIPPEPRIARARFCVER